MRRADMSKMRSAFYRPAQLALLFAVGLFLLALLVLGSLNWRDSTRLDTVVAHLERTRAVQETAQLLERRLQGRAAAGEVPDAGDLRVERRQIAALLAGGPVLKPETSHKLAQALDVLADPERDPRGALAEALRITNEALAEEARAESVLVDTLRTDARVEMHVVGWTFAGFTLLLVGGAWAFRQRIFRPIGNLRALLSRLAEGEFTPVATDNVDPMLVPLFDNYNLMVQRLRELEEAHLRHAASLQNEVRAATGTLLTQQQNLARAERLAAVGELAATVAHELRNPLAGIHMTLANLRRDAGDGTMEERLDLVLAEIQRITRLLNDLLAQAQHTPEAPREVDLARLVRELLTLVRYQTPPGVELRCEVDEGLRCRIPEDRLRQALLNLVLNAVRAVAACGSGVVTVSAHEDGRWLRLTVRDDGPGLSDAILAGGTRPFVTGREGGTGLGLAVVKRFTQEVGGELQLSNMAPRGAALTLSIPPLHHG
jgi:two-component system NtrC family sensor kinase